MTDQKSNIVLHYNKNKGGTDTFDKLCHSYTVKKRSNRWPMRYFYGILDQAIVNARILMSVKSIQNGTNKKITAMYCLEKIYLHLIKPHLEDRYKSSKLNKDLRTGIGTILKKSPASERPATDINFAIKQRCAFCGRQKDKKTDKGCGICSRPVCPEHRIIICQECGGA